MKAVIVSWIDKTTQPQLKAYVLRWIRNPDPGSPFDRKTRYFRWLPGGVLMGILRTAGYDGLLFLDERKQVVGHLFFHIAKNEKRETVFRIFSVFVREDRRGTDFTTHMLRELHFHARVHKVKWVRLGAGGNEAIASLWKKIADQRSNLPYTVPAGAEVGWLKVAA